jgi:hypothetical protein
LEYSGLIALRPDRRHDFPYLRVKEAFIAVLQREMQVVITSSSRFLSPEAMLVSAA